ncbi:MAG TPA: biotin/lipoyl-binding protein [Bryobacteraceae bacterium]
MMRRLIIALLLAGALAAAFLAGYLPRKATEQRLDSAATRRQITPPLVNAAKVVRAPKRVEVSFPGSITPITEAYIYARAAGYLKKRYVDIGDHVSGDQLLAEIDAPDLDQQVAQGKSALARQKDNSARRRLRSNN